MDAERIEPEGFENIPSLQPTGTPVNVASDKSEHVPNMQAFGRRIGEHHEVEVGLRRVGNVLLVGLVPIPAIAPLGLDGLRVVFHSFRGDLRHDADNLTRSEGAHKLRARGRTISPGREDRF